MFVTRRLRQAAQKVHTGVASAHKLSYEECAQVRHDNLFPCMTAHFKEPLLIEKGDMQYLYDHKGKLSMLGDS